MYHNSLYYVKIHNIVSKSSLFVALYTFLTQISFFNCIF